MDSKRCIKCPFRSNCLPVFLKPERPSHNDRFNMAMDVLAHDILMGSDMVNYMKNYRKDIKQNNS